MIARLFFKVGDRVLVNTPPAVSRAQGKVGTVTGFSYIKSVVLVHFDDSTSEWRSPFHMKYVTKIKT